MGLESEFIDLIYSDINISQHPLCISWIGDLYNQFTLLCDLNQVPHLLVVEASL